MVKKKPDLFGDDVELDTVPPPPPPPAIKAKCAYCNLAGLHEVDGVAACEVHAPLAASGYRVE